MFSHWLVFNGTRTDVFTSDAFNKFDYFKNALKKALAHQQDTSLLGNLLETQSPLWQGIHNVRACPTGFATAAEPPSPKPDKSAAPKTAPPGKVLWTFFCCPPQMEKVLDATGPHPPPLTVDPHVHPLPPLQSIP